MIPHHQLIIPLIIVFVFVSQLQAKAHNSTARCLRTCGKGKSATRLSYPFGFSSGCPIQLNCSSTTRTNSSARIGEFTVLNVTRSSLLVQVPAKCNRSIFSISSLFGQNYGPAWSNGFLLQQCGKPQNGCLIPTSFVESRFDGFENCNLRSSGNISCFSQEKKDSAELLGEEILKKIGCEFLFSSIAAAGPDTNSLEFQALELRWWLNGTCESLCSLNASCTNVSRADGGVGFRCQCKEGFEGDGFSAGRGCRRGESRLLISILTIYLRFIDQSKSLPFFLLKIILSPPKCGTILF